MCSAADSGVHVLCDSSTREAVLLSRADQIFTARGRVLAKGLVPFSPNPPPLTRPPLPAPPYPLPLTRSPYPPRPSHPHP